MEAIEADRIRAGCLKLCLPVADSVIIQWIGQEICNHAIIGPVLSEGIRDVALDASGRVAQELANSDLLISVDRSGRRYVRNHPSKGTCLNAAA